MLALGTFMMVENLLGKLGNFAGFFLIFFLVILNIEEHLPGSVTSLLK